MTKNNVSERLTSVKYQILATIVANVSCLGQGAAIGWTSPSLPLLLSDASPLSTPVSIEMAAWIGGILPLGALCGTFLFGVLSIYIGSKTSLLLCAFPLAIHWIILYFGLEAWAIVIARFMSGLTGGGTFVCIPLYVAEIASERVRGQLSSSLQLSFNSGILIGIIAGTYLEYFTLPLVMLSVPVFFFLAFVGFPSSPQTLLKQNKTEQAEKSLRFYRNIEGNADAANELKLQNELDKFVLIAQQNADMPPVQMTDFLTRDALRGLFIGCTLLALTQYCGAFTLSNYAKTILMQSGSDIDPNSSSIFLGLIQVTGTICASSLIDRLGRKLLLLVSTAGAVVALLVTSAYSYASTQLGYDARAFSILPVISLSFFIFIVAAGLSPVPYVLLSEVIPAKIRRIGSTLCVCIMSINSFVMLRYFPVMLDSFGLHGCMWFFACASGLSFVFTLLMVDETKGINLDQVQQNVEMKEDNPRDYRTC